MQCSRVPIDNRSISTDPPNRSGLWDRKAGRAQTIRIQAVTGFAFLGEGCPFLVLPNAILQPDFYRARRGCLNACHGHTDGMDVEFLARLQFGFTIAFHYLYPPLSIGLGTVLVVMDGLWLWKRDPGYLAMAKFWTKVFALTFAMGVATGIVMEFEFGTNWATYSRYVGDVFGSALAAEGMFAFFLESGFLAVLLFGWDRVRPGTHFFATWMVALGAHFSAVWIVVANSWMQTPAGYHIVDHGLGARAEITDFWAMVFNPSSLQRLSHTVLGCWQAGAFLVLSVSAFYLLRRRHLVFARRSFMIGLAVATVAAVLQAVTGHWSARGVAENQPGKLAAMEGHFQAMAPADMYVAGWVDAREKRVRGLRIPGGLSWLVHGDRRAPVPGLDSFPAADRPPVNATFQFYHGMVAIGVSLIVLCGIGWIAWWRGRLFENRPLLIVFVASVLGPQMANQLGWFTAEVGRQPWVVYGLLRTSEGLSRAVKAEHIIVSLVLFSVIYALLFAAFVYLLHQKIVTRAGGNNGVGAGTACHPATDNPEGGLTWTCRRPGSSSSACSSPATPCSTASISGSARFISSTPRTTIGESP